jgi:hypothetical protein
VFEWCMVRFLVAVHIKIMGLPPSLTLEVVGQGTYGSFVHPVSEHFNFMANEARNHKIGR